MKNDQLFGLMINVTSQEILDSTKRLIALRIKKK